MALQDTMHKLTLKEARKLGVAVEWTEATHAERMGGALTSALKAIATGTSTPSSMSMYRFARGDLRFAYLAPFDRAIAHPGQFHVVMPGSLASSVARVWKGLGAAWTAPDPLVAQALDADAALTSAVKKLSWRKGLAGATFTLPWTLQVRAIGDGHSHLAMNAGTYSGLLLQKPGIGMFVRVVDALGPLLPRTTTASQGFAFACLDGLASEILAGRTVLRSDGR